MVVQNIMKELQKSNAICVGEMCVGNYKIDELISNQIKESDFVIINGEGSIHDSCDRALSLLLTGVKAKVCYGKKVYLINTSFMNNDEYMVGLLKYFDGIYVRDVYSYSALVKAGVKACKMPDMTFDSIYKCQSIKKNAVCVTDSVISDVTKYLYKYCKSINGMWTPFVNIENGGNPQDILHILEHTGVMITGRFHAVCLAVQNNIPFLAIESSTKKIEALLCEFGMMDRLIKVDCLRDDLVVPEYTIEELKNIRNYVEQAPHNIERVFVKCLND